MTALAETINGLYKTELIKPGKPWRAIEDVELATARRVDWFQPRRLYEYCGDVPPIELEAAHYAQRQRPAAGRDLRSACLRTSRDGSVEPPSLSLVPLGRIIHFLR
jgi:hypothetical protein